jgi:hypothetical protein
MKQLALLSLLLLLCSCARELRVITVPEVIVIPAPPALPHISRDMWKNCPQAYDVASRQMELCTGYVKELKSLLSRPKVRE